MKEKTKVLIAGWGNVGRGVYKALEKAHDMDLAGIVTRRPQQVSLELPNIRIYSLQDLRDLEADVAVLCGGSKQDLPEQGPFYAQFFNTVDSFDTHRHVPPYIDEKTKEQMRGYFADIDAAARPSGNASAVSIGWDPGLFTMEKVLAESFLPGARAYAFYGLTERGGVSQGHSDAARKVRGVLDARSYTHAIPEAIERVRAEGNPDLKPGDMHWREVFVSAAENEDLDRIAHEIKTDPQYYADYKTLVKFISLEEMKKNHSNMPHDGLLVAVGETSPGRKSIIEYRLQLDSNPEFTGSVMVNYARAVHRANKQGRIGALRSCLDFTPAEVSPLDYNSLVRKI